MKKLILLSTTVILINIFSTLQAQPEKPPSVSVAAAPVPAGTYTLDKSHASLTFSVNHIGFSNYTMSFDNFDATLEFDPANLEKAHVTANIDPRSLDLPSPPSGFMDSLMGENWLNIARFPKIVFTSTRIKTTGDKTAIVYGDFELLGVKKTIALNVVFNGGYAGHSMDPSARVGFTANTSFKRSDFGMHYGIPAPGTSMGVSDAINVVIEAEFNGPPMSASNMP